MGSANFSFVLGGRSYKERGRIYESGQLVICVLGKSIFAKDQASSFNVEHVSADWTADLV